MDFKLFLVMQEALCGDIVFRAMMRSLRGRCPTEEIGEKLVAIAFQQGFGAHMSRRWRHPEGEASPYHETFVSISLPEAPVTEEDASTEDAADQS